MALTAFTIRAGTGNPHYTDLRHIHPIDGDARAGVQKSALCVSCHGADGDAVAPVFPRLAGQRIDYLYHRLQSFRHADPEDAYYSASPMTPIAATLSDRDMLDLAAFFAGQIPKAPQAAAGATVAPSGGEALYRRGDSSRGIPPCQGCHGADARGPAVSAGQYATYPGLRGQYFPYLVSRLSNFRLGHPADTSNAFIMHGVAGSLDDGSIQSIAAWLASLPPGDQPIELQ